MGSQLSGGGGRPDPSPPPPTDSNRRPVPERAHSSTAGLPTVPFTPLRGAPPAPTGCVPGDAP